MGKPHGHLNRSGLPGGSPSEPGRVSRVTGIQSRHRKPPLTRASRSEVVGRRVPQTTTSSSTGPKPTSATKPVSAVSVARWYDPSTGEFTTVDPMLAQTGQPYSYANDDPVNGGDPTGEFGVGTPFGCLGDCGPPNYSSSSVYGGTPKVPMYSGSCTPNLIGPCIPFNALDLTPNGPASYSNLGFTVTGVGNLYVFIYNVSPLSLDSTFQVCQSNVANQCQTQDLLWNQTMETDFPSTSALYVKDDKTRSSYFRYDITISATTDPPSDIRWGK